MDGAQNWLLFSLVFTQMHILFPELACWPCLESMSQAVLALSWYQVCSKEWETTAKPLNERTPLTVTFPHMAAMSMLTFLGSQRNSV